MSKRKPKWLARDKATYPAPTRVRIGCKVRWYYYDNYGDAFFASTIATSEGVKLQEQGYDFGFQSPGEIKRLGESEWEVTLP